MNQPKKNATAFSPVTQEELNDWVKEESDFAFEQIIHQDLRKTFGSECQHNGSYADPHTGLMREFDIRASKTLKSEAKRAMTIRLAVECKNIRCDSVVLLSCVPRSQKEAYHSVVKAADEQGSVVNFEYPRSLYQPNQSVAKNCEQVTRQQNGNFSSNHEGAYGKWSQALNSTADLIHDSCRKYKIGYSHFSAVIPIVVVPNGRLWYCDYDGSGNRSGDVQSIDRCSYYVGAEVPATFLRGRSFRVSHIEFCTRIGLAKLVEKLVTEFEDCLFDF